MSDSLIMRASAFAARAHEGQKRKHSPQAYIAHPARAAGRAAALPGSTPEMVAAEFLHDVVEDTHVTLDEIRQEFGNKVADLVYWLTKPSIGLKDKLPRAEREKIDFAHYAKMSDEAAAIKALDRIDNLMDFHGFSPDFKVQYGHESMRLWEVICGKLPPDLFEELKWAAERLILEGETEIHEAEEANLHEHH